MFVVAAPMFKFSYDTVRHGELVKLFWFDSFTRIKAERIIGALKVASGVEAGALICLGHCGVCFISIRFIVCNTV